MGAENSKPVGVSSQHIFNSEAPVSFSHELVNSLQSNTQTDSTRQKQQELAYQQRLTQDLERIREKESQNIAELAKTLSGEAEQPAPEPSFSESVTEKLSDATSLPSTLADKQKQRDMSHASVTKEIEALKKKLETRKKLEQADAAVNKAKEDVVNCLRTHDRRPLDCYLEVENFKREVGRLEKDFVERTIR